MSLRPLSEPIARVIGDLEAAVRELERQKPVDTRCHHPSCVAAGKCAYGNEVAPKSKSPQPTKEGRRATNNPQVTPRSPSVTKQSDRLLTDSELQELHRIERARMLARERHLQMRVGDRAIALQRRVDDRQSAEWVAEAVAEAAALAQLRGDALERAHGHTGPLERLSPLVRLHKAGIITDEQFGAGGRYGRTWRRLYANGNGSGTGNGELDPLESRIADLRRLDEARGYARENVVDVGGRRIVQTGLGGDARLVSLCDDVCGEEKSLRETLGTSAHKRKRGMDRLHFALGLLALHYGLIRTREDELKAA